MTNKPDFKRHLINEKLL